MVIINITYTHTYTHTHTHTHTYIYIYIQGDSEMNFTNFGGRFLTPKQNKRKQKYKHMSANAFQIPKPAYSKLWTVGLSKTIALLCRYLFRTFIIILLCKTL